MSVDFSNYSNLLLIQKIVDSIPVRVFWKDRKLRYLGCNTLFAKDAGFATPEELIGKDDYQMGWRDQAELYRADDFRVLESGEATYNYEEPQTTPDGQTIWLRTSKVPLRNENGDLIGVLGIYDDITAEKQAAEKIQHLASFPQLDPVPIVELTEQNKIGFINPAARSQFPDLEETTIQHPLLHALAAQLQHLSFSESISLLQEVAINDKTYELHVSVIPEFSVVRIYVHDITERKQYEQEILRLATRDSLTGCLNRRAFLIDLGTETQRSRRHHFPVCLLMFDIDHFKMVNDTCGHDAGDTVLQKLATLVTENIRSSDRISRWGGEEFMIMMPHVGLEEARAVTEKIRALVDKYDFGEPKHITISIGLTILRDTDDDITVCKRVDDAMYLAKNNGRNRVEEL